MKTITLLLTLLFVIPALAETESAKINKEVATPTMALKAFKQALKKNDTDTAWSHIVLYDILPERSIQAFKQKIQKMIKLQQSGWDFTIMEEKVDGDCAVIIINESKKDGKASFDIDPAYLLKQNGEWKVFVDITSYRLATEAEKDKAPAFERLKQWYDARKKELKAQQQEQK